MTSSAVLAALRQVAAELPQLFDPTCEITMRDAMRELRTQDRDVVDRELSARGWVKRRARLANGRTGDVWRMPGGRTQS